VNVIERLRSRYLLAIKVFLLSADFLNPEPDNSQSIDFLSKTLFGDKLYGNELST
jgi:hypothetical protein